MPLTYLDLFHMRSEEAAALLHDFTGELLMTKCFPTLHDPDNGGLDLVL